MVAITQRSFAAPPRPPRWATSAPSRDSRSGGPPRRDRPARRARGAPRSRSPCPGAARCARREPGGSRSSVGPVDPLEARAAGAAASPRSSLPRAQQSESTIEWQRKISRPPGRSSRWACGIQTYGSHQMAAPYSEKTRSNEESGSGGSSALAWISGNSSPCSACRSRAVASWFSERSRPDRPCAEPHEPRAPVAGAAAEVDHVEAAHVRQDPHLLLGHLPGAPPWRVAGPAPARVLDPVRGVPVPLVAVAGGVLGELHAREANRGSASRPRRRARGRRGRPSRCGGTGSSSRPPSRSFHRATARPPTMANG